MDLTNLMKYTNVADKQKDLDKISSRSHFDEDELILTVFASSRALDEVIIRNKHETTQLEQEVYCKYQIIKPKGFENEEILHCRDRSYESLLAAVFVTLSEVSQDNQEQKARVIR